MMTIVENRSALKTTLSTPPFRLDWWKLSFDGTLYTHITETAQAVVVMTNNSYRVPQFSIAENVVQFKQCFIRSSAAPRPGSSIVQLCRS